MSPVTGRVRIGDAIPCGACGLPFVPRQGNQRFCSPACYDRHYNARRPVMRAPEPRDKRVRDIPHLRLMARDIWRDLAAGPRDTGYFTRTYGSSWRTRVSDLRLYLEAQTPARTVRTTPIKGSACKLYSLEDVT